MYKKNVSFHQNVIHMLAHCKVSNLHREKHCNILRNNLYSNLLESTIGGKDTISSRYRSQINIFLMVLFIQNAKNLLHKLQ